jgi:DNA-binding transcriptional MocR family regulator
VRRRALPLPLATGEVTESLDPRTMSICRIMGPLQARSESPGFLLSLANIDPALLPEKQLTAHLVEQTRIAGNRSLDYLYLPGDLGLREQIARVGVDAGIVGGPDDVLITNGCTEAYHLALQAVCRPGDLIALESPSYMNFGLLAQELGLRVLEIPSDPQDGLDIDILRFALTHHDIRAVLLVSNYSNPLGASIPEEGKRELVELLEEHRVPLIEDDIFGDVCFGYRRPGTCKAYDRTGNVIYCSSFSKSLTAGWRLGWVLGGKYKERIVRLKSLFSLTTSSVTQRALAAFLREESYEKHLRRLRASLARQMGCLQETVAKSFPEGTRTSRPQGGLTLWVELPSGVNSLELYHRAMAAGIGLTPGPAFSISGKFGNFIRLCTGFWNREIAEAVARLGGLVGSQMS